MKIPSVDMLKEYYKLGRHSLLAKWLPHFQDSTNKFVRFLFNSNLLTIGSKLELKPLTFGCDPEFILADKDTDEVVLFSSEYTDDYFGISEAEIGADYGLLEFRTPPVDNIIDFIEIIGDFHKRFSETYDNIYILKKEAIRYNHRRSRIKEILENKKEINYGPNRGKDTDVWSGNDDIVIDNEQATTFSAYGKPKYQQYREDILSAGGHIHVGGTFIKMLSFAQLQLLVQKFDKEILPLCHLIETEAGELRKEAYGQDGEFRIKDYGIEYRSPSNAIFWRENTRILLKIMTKIDRICKTMALV